MATVTSHDEALQNSPQAIEHEFRRLEAIWNAETGYSSSDDEIVAHPAFQAIIRMGWDVVPFMLQDLKQGPSLWVWALPAITGANPVNAADRGNIEKMSEAWLHWAQANGHL